MARHRNVRNMNYDEEYDFDDTYGRSVEDDYCISPSTAAEFMYDRSTSRHSMSAFLGSKEHSSKDTESEEESSPPVRHERQVQYSPLDEARLQSCLEGIRNVVGDNIPEQTLIDAVVRYNFDMEKALDAVLSNRISPDKPKPQRPKREGRRSGISIRKPEIQPKQNASNGEIHGISEKVARLEIPSPTEFNKKDVSPENNRSAKVDNNRLEGKQKSPKLSPDKDSVSNTAEKSVTDSGDSIKESSSISNQKLPTTKSAVAHANALTEYEKRKGSCKELLNLVVIGHVDAGKSTLMGHLLCLLGAVSKKIMHKYEQESKKIGKASFMFAWVLDETGEERSRGITMDVGQFKFETATKQVTLLDAPGHKDFIPNMITGASQADVAILVVDATRGEFETGFESGGQTREHALLVRSLGVPQLVVAVNKLDTVNWSQDRFNEITKKLGHFLKQAGFKEADVSYIPCSGLTGENLIESPKEPVLCSWYSGPSLLQQIDNFRAPERPVSKPFRFCVGDVFKGQGSGFCVSGRIETGFVQNSDKVLVMPQGEQAQIKGIAIDDLSVQIAFAGDQVVLTLGNIDINNVTIGSILCDIAQPIRNTIRIQARIVIFNIDIPITKGFPVVFHYQALCEPAVIKKLISQLHKSSGEVIKKKPRCLGKQTSALIEIETGRPVCVELYKDIKELGRFMLRSAGSTIAAGLITEIL